MTLPEVLVVAGILVILIVLLLPVIGTVRRRSTNIVCAARLRELAFACQQYANVHDGWFPMAAGDGQPMVIPNLLPSRLLNDLRRYIGYPAVDPTTGVGGLSPMVQCPTVEGVDLDRGPFKTASADVVTYYTGFAYLGGLGPNEGEVRVPGGAAGKYVPGRAAPPRTRVYGPPVAPGSSAGPGRALRAGRAPAKRGDKGVLWADEVFLSAPSGGYWRFAHARHGAAPGTGMMTYADARACLGQHRAFAEGHVEWVAAEHLGLQSSGGEVGAAGLLPKKPSPIDAAASYKAGTGYWWY